MDMATAGFIRCVIDDRLKMYQFTTKPKLYDKDDYRACIYGLWALQELRRYLIDRGKYAPQLIIEEFRWLMDQYCCNAKCIDASYMFSIAYDISTEMLDLCIRGGW